ncbi:MAG: S8 family serine peptidase [Bryobacterales bacterium]|nr:S8 family serine peptidase [Bryobacterales bacterium]
MPKSNKTSSGRRPQRPTIANVVLFVEDPKKLDADDTVAAQQLRARSDSGWREIEKSFSPLRIHRLIPEDARNRFSQAVSKLPGTARHRIPRIDFSRYFRVTTSAAAKEEEICEALAKLSGVELAYAEPVAVPCNVYPDDDLHFPNQRYLHPGPEGVGVSALWPRNRDVNGAFLPKPVGIAGSDGVGQELMLVDRGFLPSHEDLAGHFHPQGNSKDPLFGTNELTSRYHGTSVLGVVCAVDNQVGCCGAVPNLSKIRFVSPAGLSGSPDHPVAEVLIEATTALLAGGGNGAVLLIELHWEKRDDRHSPYAAYKDKTPIETFRPEFEAILSATSAGIVVVEAAGNGGHDLDQLLQPRRPHPVVDFASEDSGAILVAASSSTQPYLPLKNSSTRGSNFGTRVNCFAWGQNVATCTTNQFGTMQDSYTTGFGETSAAAAIIAGAALSVQGIAEGRWGRRLTPSEMRVLLTHRAVGTPSANGALDKIGLMPNLAKLQSLIQPRSAVRTVNSLFTRLNLSLLGLNLGTRQSPGVY